MANFELDKGQLAKSQTLVDKASEKLGEDILEANKIHAFVQLKKMGERGDGKELLDHIRSWNGHYRETLVAIDKQFLYLNGKGIFEKKELLGTVTEINRQVGQAETYGRNRGDSVKKFLAFAKSELEEWEKKNKGKPRPEQDGVTEKDVKTLKDFDLNYIWTLNTALAVTTFWTAALK